jgi:integrase
LGRPARRLRFGEFACEWFDTTVHLKPATQVPYEMLLRRHLLPYFGDLRLGRIDRITIQAWLSELQADGVGSGTIRNAHRVLSRILSEAVHSGLLPTNAALRILLPKSSKQEMRFLTPSEIRALAEAIEPPYRGLILTAGFTGLRWGELAGLRLERLDLLRGSIDVRESVSEVSRRLVRVSPKSGERRTVPLPRFLCEILSDHIAQYSNRDGLVFTSPENGPLRHSNFYRVTSSQP